MPARREEPNHPGCLPAGEALGNRNTFPPEEIQLGVTGRLVAPAGREIHDADRFAPLPLNERLSFADGPRQIWGGSQAPLSSLSL
jgi:hypothetical protein